MRDGCEGASRSVEEVGEIEVTNQLKRIKGPICTYLYLINLRFGEVPISK